MHYDYMNTFSFINLQLFFFLALYSLLCSTDLKVIRVNRYIIYNSYFDGQSEGIY